MAPLFEDDGAQPLPSQMRRDDRARRPRTDDDDIDASAHRRFDSSTVNDSVVAHDEGWPVRCAGLAGSPAKHALPSLTLRPMVADGRERARGFEEQHRENRLVCHDHQRQRGIAAIHALEHRHAIVDIERLERREPMDHHDGQPPEREQDADEPEAKRIARAAHEVVAIRHQSIELPRLEWRSLVEENSLGERPGHPPLLQVERAALVVSHVKRDATRGRGWKRLLSRVRHELS